LYQLAIFLVPSVPLVYQQSEFIRQETKVNVKNFSGDMGVDFWDRDQWLKELEIGKTDVIVCTPQIFYNCLAHAYIFMDQCSLLIIDECHHARKKHPLNTTLLHFYHSIGSGRTRPKILGLTASPIWNPVNPLKSLEELESNLQASIIAVKCNLEELESFSSKPVEIVEYYHDTQLGEAGQLYTSLMAMDFVGTTDTPWQSIVSKADVARSVLGPVGVNYFLVQLFAKPVEMELRAASFTLRMPEEQLAVLKRASKVITSVNNSLPTSLSREDLPNKVSKLVQILSRYRESSDAAMNEEAGFQCIIFVVQRHIAFGLSWMLERVEELKSWLKIKTLVGHGIRKSLEGQSQDFKQQQDTVKEFKDGKYNVLISTA
jgi:endoribonuclease Dicer